MTEYKDEELNNILVKQVYNDKLHLKKMKRILKQFENGNPSKETLEYIETKIPTDKKLAYENSTLNALSFILEQDDNLSLLKTANKEYTKELKNRTLSEKQCKFNEYKVLEETYKHTSRKKVYSKILAIIKAFQHCRHSEKPTLLYIATTSKWMNKICGSVSTSALIIKAMEKIGLICTYDNKYYFDPTKESKGKCRGYAWNPQVEKRIIEFCQANNITACNKLEYTDNNNKKQEIDINDFNQLNLAFTLDAVRISSKVNLLKPQNYTKKQFEQFLTDCLYTNYPQLEELDNTINIINNKYLFQYPDFQLKGKPSFTWDKGKKRIRKIGFRVTNALATAKNDDIENITKHQYTKEEREDFKIYKKDILKKYCLDYSYDVTSSIPRITYLYNYGEWLNENIDLYEQAYYQYIRFNPQEAYEFDNIRRKQFKSLAMRGLFDDYNKIAAHTKYEASKKIKYYRKDWQIANQAMLSYKYAIESVIGTTIGSEAFLHESCIYVDAMLKAFEQCKQPGQIFFNVYDGFYSRHKITIWSELIRSSAIRYHKQYIAPIDNKQTPQPPKWIFNQVKNDWVEYLFQFDNPYYSLEEASEQEWLYNDYEEYYSLPDSELSVTQIMKKNYWLNKAMTSLKNEKTLHKQSSMSHLDFIKQINNQIKQQIQQINTTYNHYISDCTNTNTQIQT